MYLSVDELLNYTDEERARWEQWFSQNGEDLLKMPLAGDRENTVGALILHIFGPELRYVQRIRSEALSEYRGRPSSHIDELFGFGLETRTAMRQFVRSTRPEDWDRVVDFAIAGRRHTVSIRKAVFHVLIHELRHWAQIARIMRERGFAPPGDHDLLMSSALV